jgi:hypothetical protein
MNTRSFESHVDLLESFSMRVAALSHDAWDRLREQCAPLSGRSPDMLLSRAQLFASSAAAQFAEHRSAPLTRAIADVTTSTMTAIGFAFEALFTVAPALDGPREPRRQPLSSPHADRYADALHRISAAVWQHTRRSDGVGTAIEAAAGALLRRDFIPDREFQAVYAWVEAEIPYESIDQRPHAMR